MVDKSKSRIVKGEKDGVRVKSNQDKVLPPLRTVCFEFYTSIGEFPYNPSWPLHFALVISLHHPIVANY